MKKLLLFDVDGTITESGEIIDNSMKSLIKNISKYYDIGVLGGGRLDKILFQMNGLHFKHYFTECGCVYNINKSINNISLAQMYAINIRKHKLYQKINILVKRALLYISKVDYLISGNFIDLRNGMIYISLIGMNANQDERKMFIEKNHICGYRKELLDILITLAQELEIADQITICEGGSVGLAIYPNENDKIQVLSYLNEEYEEIHYFGDKYNENGNDYKIINAEGVIGYRINCVNDTKVFLTNILKKFEFKF
jgi:phosphomannomutase